jgi:hypothetical protein
VKKIFAYGVRNGFGMAFDPLTGNLWTQENGDDAFDEMNRVRPGFNGGWIQTMGPINRVAEFKAIESTYGAGNLQQLRWPPGNIADTPQLALPRLYMLPGAQYTDPEFSWKFAVAPSTIGFVNGTTLGAPFANNLFVGASRTTLLNGYLLRFKFTADRQHFSFSDPHLADLVADNTDKFDVTESESLLIGRDFGITTDIQTSPDGNVFVVSLSNGAVYEISNRSALFVANLDGFQETPPHATPARGTATLLLDKPQTTALVSLRFRNLTGPETAAHIHGPAVAGQSAPPVFDLPAANFTDFQINLTETQVSDLKAGKYYVNVHSTAFPAGEIRGQFGVASQSSIVQFDVADQEIPEGAHFKTINVMRLGELSSAATVDYATSDGIATDRADYTAARGTLRFAPGEAQESFDVLITEDGYTEPAEGFVVTLSNPTGPVVLNTPASVALAIIDNDNPPPIPNPIDDAQNFVRQHYHDFLNREPDDSGLAFWTNEITQCGSNAQCVEVKRINVSASFFLSIEFQQTGYLVYRMYKVAYGDAMGTSTLGGSHQLAVPVIRLNEFLPDTQQIGQGVVVGQTGWEQQLENNKVAFAADFVARARFMTAFATTLTPAQLVDALYANAGVTPSAAERSSVISEFGSATNTTDTAARARALRRVAENATLAQQEFNRAFVLMQYFGYLRRNPNDLPESTLDYTGYDFWLTKLNQFNGNFINAEMVKAFISSDEYRHRFGP